MSASIGKNYEWTVYEECTAVGYRHLLSKGIKAAYPFGFGLSCSKFSYSDFKISRDKTGISLSCKVTNSGEMAGKEVVQGYVTSPSSHIRELKAFGKTKLLPAGETEEITLHIDTEDLKYYSVENGGWALEEGKYLVELCADAEHSIIGGEVRLNSER